MSTNPSPLFDMSKATPIFDMSKAAPIAGSGIDASNPQGQGTYQMRDQTGKVVPVPYGQVKQAGQQGYSFADDRDKWRYAKDYGYDPNRDRIAEGIASDQHAPLPMQAISGVVKGIGTMAKPVMDVVGRLGGVPQNAIDSSLQAQTPMETAGKVGMVGAAMAPAAISAPIATATGLVGGTLGAGAGSLIAQAAGASPENAALLQDAGGLAGGIGGAKLGSMASGAVSNFVNPKGQWTGAAKEDIPWLKLASRVGPAGSGQSALGVKDPLAMDLKATLGQVPGVMDAKNPLEFSKAAEHFLNTTAGPEYRAQVDPIANELIKPNQGVGSGLPQRVAIFNVPSTGKPLGTHPTIAETEGALRDVNELLTRSYNSPANASDPATIQNYQAIAGQLRSALNNRIGELSNLSPQTVSALRQRTGQLSNIVANSRERYIGNMGGITSPQVAAVGGGAARSMPARFIRSTLLQPLENYQFRKDLAGAGQVAPQVDPNSPLGQFYALKAMGQGNQ